MPGAGPAGIRVCEQVVRSMVTNGLPGQDARARICAVEIEGLLTTDRTDLTPAQHRLTRPPPCPAPSPASLSELIEACTGFWHSTGQPAPIFTPARRPPQGYED